jgi:hypothetical protein
MQLLFFAAAALATEAHLARANGAGGRAGIVVVNACGVTVFNHARA